MTTPTNYKDYPKHIKIDGRVNMILCTSCGKHETMFCGPLDDFMSGVQQFIAYHDQCRGIVPINLPSEDWVEVMSALTSKAALVERGDYGEEDKEADYNPKRWEEDLLRIHDTLAKALDEKGIIY